MATLSISLPQQLITQINEATNAGGFSTRSEFIRNLLRTYFIQNQIEVFIPKPISEIKLGLAKTGKYSQKFIDSVTKGLSKSSAYAD